MLIKRTLIPEGPLAKDAVKSRCGFNHHRIRDPRGSTWMGRGTVLVKSQPGDVAAGTDVTAKLLRMQVAPQRRVVGKFTIAGGEALQFGDG